MSACKPRASVRGELLKGEINYFNVTSFTLASLALARATLIIDVAVLSFSLSLFARHI